MSNQFIRVQICICLAIVNELAVSANELGTCARSNMNEAKEKETNDRHAYTVTQNTNASHITLLPWHIRCHTIGRVSMFTPTSTSHFRSLCVWINTIRFVDSSAYFCIVFRCNWTEWKRVRGDHETHTQKWNPTTEFNSIRMWSSCLVQCVSSQ